MTFPTALILAIITTLAYNGRYYEILALLIWAAFIEFVVNSRKYPKIDKFFDDVF